MTDTLTVFVDNVGAFYNSVFGNEVRFPQPVSVAVYTTPHPLLTNSYPIGIHPIQLTLDRAGKS